MDFKVSGMTCGGCARAVEKAVLKADPDARVSVDLEGGAVSVESARPAETFRTAIEDAGYEVAA